MNHIQVFIAMQINIKVVILIKNFAVHIYALLNSLSWKIFEMKNINKSAFSVVVEWLLYMDISFVFFCNICTLFDVLDKPLVLSMHDLVEEIVEGKKKKLCCYVDANPTPNTMIWLNGSLEILVTHNVNKTCYTIKSVNRYDQGYYSCIAENIIGTGSVTVVLKVKCKCLNS